MERLLLLHALCNAEGYQAKEVSGSSEAIDNYILSKLKRLGRIVKQGLDTYDVALSCNEIASFMEILNNWYIRRTRDRFWSGDQQAFDVLYTVLVNLSKIMAPLMPFLCEYVYKNLTGGESVHLTDYPQLENIKLDETLVDEMALFAGLMFGRQVYPRGEKPPQSSAFGRFDGCRR